MNAITYREDINKIISIAIIGLGQQAEEYIKIIKSMVNVKIIAVCDKIERNFVKIPEINGIPYFNSPELLIEKCTPNVIIICLPHDQYLHTISTVSKKDILIIKEKPFATSYCNACTQVKILSLQNNECKVLLKRRYNPSYIFLEKSLSSIGNIYSAEFRYSLSISRLDIGWRAHKSLSGGGALIDMGYHMIDLVIWFLGVPDVITARMTSSAKPDQHYDVEDTAHLLMEYEKNTSRNEAFFASLMASRSYGSKEEAVRIIGTNGILIAGPRSAQLISHDGIIIDAVNNDLSDGTIVKNQLSHMINHEGDFFESTPNYYLNHQALIEAAYISAASRKSISLNQITHPYTQKHHD